MPPHVHAFSGDDEALVDIRTGKIIKGYLPGKKLLIVEQWLEKAETRNLTEENFYELNPGLRPVDEAIKGKEKIAGKKQNKKHGKQE